MKTRHLLMLAGVLGSGALAWFGNRDDPADLAEPVARGAARAPAVVGRASPAPAMAAPSTTSTTSAPAGPAGPKRAAGAASPELPVLALLDRAAAAERARGQGRGSLFGAQSWAPPAVQAVVAIVAAPVPTAPPLPFSYIGRQTQAGRVDVFLAQGDKVHVVQVHSLLDKDYRVDAISPTAVSFTYLPLNTPQQLAIRTND